MQSLSYPLRFFPRNESNQKIRPRRRTADCVGEFLQSLPCLRCVAMRLYMICRITLNFKSFNKPKSSALFLSSEKDYSVTPVCDSTESAPRWRLEPVHFTVSRLIQCQTPQIRRLSLLPLAPSPAPWPFRPDICGWHRSRWWGWRPRGDQTSCCFQPACA